MVVAYGTSKKTGSLYSRCTRIREDEKNGSFGYLDEKDQYYTNDLRPLGTTVELEMSEV
jgi:hypothetical protein